MGWKVLACVAVLALGGCVTTQEPDQGQIALDEAATRCGVPYLAGAPKVPDFRTEKPPKEEVAKRFSCLRAGIASSQALAGHPNMDAVSHMVGVAEYTASAVADGVDPMLAQNYYSKELMAVNSTLSQREARRQAAIENADRLERERAVNALAVFGATMQNMGAAMQQAAPAPAPSRIAPFSCQRFGAEVRCW